MADGRELKLEQNIRAYLIHRKAFTKPCICTYVIHSLGIQDDAEGDKI